MGWFEKICHRSGLMIHHIVTPPGNDPGSDPGSGPGNNPDVQQVHKTTEEKKLNDAVTLRRTTIDEIEIKKK